jgi:hypothetical protein
MRKIILATLAVIGLNIYNPSATHAAGGVVTDPNGTAPDR